MLLLRRMLPRLHFPALAAAAACLGEQIALPPPEDLPVLALADDVALAPLHRLLFEVEVVEGELLSPCGVHRYRVHDAIVNMIIDLGPIVEQPKPKRRALEPASTAGADGLPSHTLYRRKEKDELSSIHADAVEGTPKLALEVRSFGPLFGGACAALEW
jgi:hypothetical protein